jgi:hypothetical protein
MTLSGLAGGTSYDYFMRSVCGAGDTSAWSTRATFATTCGNYTLPFLENFQHLSAEYLLDRSNGALNTGSTLTGTSSAWIGANYLNAVATNPASKNHTRTIRLKDWLISPSIALGTPAPGTNFAWSSISEWSPMPHNACYNGF